MHRPRLPDRRLVLGAAALLAVIASAPAAAQSAWPARPLTFVVPYTAGGAADVFARQLAEKLAVRLGQPVVVDNRGGANGNLGSVSVVRAPADGYTLLLGTQSTIAINPPLYGERMPYDPARDLAPVSTTHAMSNVLVVPAASPYKTLADLVAAAKAKPGTLAYASAGVGNTQHIAGEMLAQLTGIQIEHVPYKGGGQAMNDVLGGQVPMMFNNVPAVVPQVRAGKMRALAIAATQRSPQLPDVPTADEAGVRGLTSTVWNGVLVRAGTPAPVIERLNREIVAVLQEPAMRQSLEQQGFEVIPSSPAQFADLIRSDMPRMRELVQRSGAKAD